jgi:ribonucleoside-diphosphate reductase beta chain
VNASKSYPKSLINSESEEANQLLPIRYSWAWEHFLNGCANNWLPHEISMHDDATLWKSNHLTPDERHLLKLNFSFFGKAESLVANNLSLTVYRYLTNAECRQFLLRQAFEESIHAYAFLYISESLTLDTQLIFHEYQKRDSIRAKNDFSQQLTSEVLRQDFTTKTFDGAQKFLENLIGYYLIIEGIFFYGGFAMVLAFQRQNKMRGVRQIYEFILRDETVHLNFGIDLINGIKEENPDLWTSILQNRIQEQIQEGVELEWNYTLDCLPHGIFGLTPSLYRRYIEYIADRRLERIGLPPHYHVENPFDWMSESIDLAKEKNFFENVVIEYQPLKWNDEKQ